MIAECMISLGYNKECVKIYKIITKSIIDEGLYRLGIERLSSHQIQKNGMGIFTWLRSHTNCHLCRARIVSATTTATSTNPNPVGSSSAATATGAVVVDSEETEIVDYEVEICDRPVEELGDDDDGDGEKEGMPMPMALSESGLRVLSVLRGIWGFKCRVIDDLFLQSQDPCD
ncbi:hypothetical protein Syun_014091 [Stephania yunnanensis]|uniref:Uncharacterized protein n=1 Tax=Stephania yunnanensis TaxID=152371 RepID=A0AAP0JJR4_9MAGN